MLYYCCCNILQLHVVFGHAGGVSDVDVIADVVSSVIGGIVGVVVGGCGVCSVVGAGPFASFGIVVSVNDADDVVAGSDVIGVVGSIATVVIKVALVLTVHSLSMIKRLMGQKIPI